MNVNRWMKDLKEGKKDTLIAFENKMIGINASFSEDNVYGYMDAFNTVWSSDEELAKQLGLTDEELCSWQTQLKVTNVVSLNEFEETGSEPMIDSAHPVRFSQPEEVVEEEELKEKLAESLELLTEKERRVIELYYYEDMTLKEISKILEVSESRISQLHTKALNKMRKKMGVYMNILTE